MSGDQPGPDPGFVSPSGPPPSGPSYGRPAYGPPNDGQPGWAGWTPAYTGALPGTQNLGSATTSMVLGIISLASLPVALFCCFTIPGVLCAPVGLVIGLRARRTIDQQPHTYGNRSTAVAGIIMGAIGTVLAVLVIAGAVALGVFISGLSTGGR